LPRKKIKYALLENVTIGPAVAEGNCIARIDNQVVFVKYAAPNDVADIQITGKKKKFLEGKISNFHSKSELRTEPVCEHYGLCGGCKWQHLKYEEQLKFKQQQVLDAMQRIGGITEFQCLPIVGCKDIYGYRNKLDMTFSNKAWVTQFNKENPENFNALGFHIPGKFDKVLDIHHCHLMPEPLNEITRSVKQFCEENGYSFFDLRDQHGLMRNLLLRCNSDGQWMVLFSFFENDSEKINAILEYTKNTFPQISSLVYVVNEKRNDTLNDLEIQLYYGDAYLIENLYGKKFKIRPQSFFQTNTKQAETLYQITGEFADLKGTELVYDLYTGTGSIAIYLAEKAKHFVGIEYVEAAVMDARENMELNGVSNLEFYAGDMKDILTAEFIAENGKPDVVITDPPRDGMHPAVVERLLEMEAPKMVYVSCNPATQARDAKMLSEKYRLVKIQPVDMFPHTHHVESVALFELIN